MILESALSLNIIQYIELDAYNKEITKQICLQNKVDHTSEIFKSCLSVLRKMFEWLFHDISAERSIAM